MLMEIKHPKQVTQVLFAGDDRLVTTCADNVIRTYNACTFEYIYDGGCEGAQISLYKDIKAVGNGNIVKVIDKKGVVIWASRNYQLTLKNSNITDVIGLSERNRMLWEQHNSKFD